MYLELFQHSSFFQQETSNLNEICINYEQTITEFQEYEQIKKWILRFGGGIDSI